MADLTEIINGLEDLIKDRESFIPQNPKDRDEFSQPFEYDAAILREAIDKLKAQQPRIMTLEEVESWLNTPQLEKEPIFVEFASERNFAPSGWRIDFFGFNTKFGNRDIYGRFFRCWNSRPSEEQRKAVKWK